MWTLDEQGKSSFLKERFFHGHDEGQSEEIVCDNPSDNLVRSCFPKATTSLTLFGGKVGAEILKAIVIIIS